jgi:arginase
MPAAERGTLRNRPLDHVDLIGVPLDLGAGRRGVDMGPSAFRLTGLPARIRALGFETADRGDIVVPIPEKCTPGDERKRYVAEITTACRALAAQPAVSVGAHRIPICLGGDHSLGAGSIAGAARALRESGGEIGVVWVDAHADMNTPESSPSGNVHGMPLAALLGHGPEELVAIGGGRACAPGTSLWSGCATWTKGSSRSSADPASTPTRCLTSTAAAWARSSRRSWPPCRARPAAST